MSRVSLGQHIQRHPGLWGWLPETPRGKWPRKLKGAVAERLAVGGTLFGRALIGYTGIDGYKMLADGRNYTASGGTFSDANLSEIGGRRLRDFNPPAKRGQTLEWGYSSIHGYLDADAARHPYSLVAQDLLYVTNVSGTDNWAGFGWMVFNTAGNQASVAGVFWEYDISTSTWHARVKDGTGTPSTSQHDTDSMIGASVWHRLAIVLDGSLHQARFYIDGALISTYAPTAPGPGQFGTVGTPKFGYAIVTGDTTASDEIQLNMWGGGNPSILGLIDSPAAA